MKSGGVEYCRDRFTGADFLIEAGLANYPFFAGD
jgi:hypothetical protein